MKIVDVNLYTGGFDALKREASPDKLAEMMKTYGISCGIIYHQFAKLDPKKGNSLTFEISLSSGGALKSCVVLDPALGEDSLEGTGGLADRLRAFSPSAAVVFPTEQRVVFDAFYFSEILESLNVLSMPLIIRANYDFDFFRHLPEIAFSYPNVKFILTDYGICGSRNVFPLLKYTKNVFFTIEKMLDHRQIEEICERGGEDRLLFGSGYPDFSPAGALGLVKFAFITEKQKVKIFSLNWEEIGQ
ncbi:MAG: amidohydrolase family protein [Clostridia bacterium]|nr:amidohydrolase family protein [Clostridia bacterium]